MRTLTFTFAISLALSAEVVTALEGRLRFGNDNARRVSVLVKLEEEYSSKNQYHLIFK